jgi:hypothetical protein
MYIFNDNVYLLLDPDPAPQRRIFFLLKGL